MTQATLGGPGQEAAITRMRRLVRERLIERPDSEFRQHLHRYVVAGTFFAIIVPISKLLGHDTGITVAAIQIYLAAALGLTIDMLRRPGKSRMRKVIGSLIDPPALCLYIHEMGAGGGLMLWLLMLMPLGDGFRYGLRELHFRGLMTTMSLAVLFEFSPEWRQSTHLEFAVLGGNVVIWAYSAFLITRLRTTDSAIRTRMRRDALTGMDNRLMFAEHIGQMLRASRRTRRWVACGFIDLDGFKLVNDTHGHPVGDRLLKEVANALRESVRATDVVARISGDEFTFALDCDRAAEDASAVCRTILAALHGITEIDGRPIRVSASIGVAFHRYGPDDPPIDAERLIDRADALMYEVKRAGKRGFRMESIDDDPPPQWPPTSVLAPPPGVA